MANVREFFWSNRILQWLPVAGTVGVMRAYRPAAVLAGAWVATATIVGVAAPSPFGEGRFFVALIPAWPAYAVLVAGIPALVPTLLGRLGPRAQGEPRVVPVSRAGAAALFTLIALVMGISALILAR